TGTPTSQASLPLSRASRRSSRVATPTSARTAPWDCDGHTMTTTARTVLVSGASGFIGSELTQQLRADGHTVLRLVRRPAEERDEYEWHPEHGALPVEAIERADAVVNLSGAS